MAHTSHLHMSPSDRAAIEKGSSSSFSLQDAKRLAEDLAGGGSSFSASSLSSPLELEEIEEGDEDGPLTPIPTKTRKPRYDHRLEGR
jgi:hypothetical protein